MPLDMRSRDFSEFTLGTLASLTAITLGTKIDTSRLQGCDFSRARYKVDWQGKTAGVTEGPIVYGVHNNKTLAEIALFFAADPQSSEDEIAVTESKLPVIVLGMVGQPSTNSGDKGGQSDAMMLNFKWPRWAILEGEFWAHFVFNLNPADPLATGMTLQLYTEVYGEWLND